MSNQAIEKTFVPQAELDAQEGLTFDKLSRINNNPIPFSTLVHRPKDSYIELINWIESNFSKHLGDSASMRLVRFVHNKIVVDGTFLQFCKDSNAKVSCLYSDSIVSWKSDLGNEKFFMQGVFLIEKDNMKFIHSALFHKGNQNEDEISFCILVAEELAESYFSFRNEFDEWSAHRDRSNLHIRVIEGDDIPYERDLRWEDIFLPDSLKNDIKTSVEGFLKSKKIYESKKIPWKRGIILWGTPGNGKTSLIKTIISNYDFKPVTILPGSNDDAIRDAFFYAQEQNPALLFLEDLDSLLENINISLFLNLMDGLSTKNGIFIVATANNLDALKDNIKNRPSRFDRKFEIPSPNEDMCIKYLKKWFSDFIQDKEIIKLSALTYKHGFSYSHLKDLYLSSVYIAIADNREQPTIDDINQAMRQIIDDNFKKTSKTIGIDKYLDKNPGKKK